MPLVKGTYTVVGCCSDYKVRRPAPEESGKQQIRPTQSPTTPRPTGCPGRAACGPACPAHLPAQAPAPAAQHPTAATGGATPRPPPGMHAAAWGWPRRWAALQQCMGCAHGSTTPAHHRCSGPPLQQEAKAEAHNSVSRGRCNSWQASKPTNPAETPSRERQACPETQTPTCMPHAPQGTVAGRALGCIPVHAAAHAGRVLIQLAAAVVRGKGRMLSAKTSAALGQLAARRRSSQSSMALRAHNQQANHVPSTATAPAKAAALPPSQLRT